MDYLNYIANKITKEFGIRYTYNEKTVFLDFIDKELKSLGYEIEIIQGKNIKKSRNLCTLEEDAEFIFTAHYDTPETMPIILGVMFKLFGHTRQIIATIAYIIALILLIAFMENIFNVNMPSMIILVLMIFPMLIKNKSNYNDNSSGVITLLNIAYELKNNNKLKGKAYKIKIVFIDNEESGLLGSSLLSNYWGKKEGFYNKKIINFDCVGIGDIPMIYYSKDLDYDLAYLLEDVLKGINNKTKKYRCKYYPLSDDFSFRKNKAVSVIFANKTILPGGYHIPNVHCSRDNVLEIENIRWLTEEILNKLIS